MDGVPKDGTKVVSNLHINVHTHNYKWRCPVKHGGEDCSGKSVPCCFGPGGPGLEGEGTLAHGVLPKIFSSPGHGSRTLREPMPRISAMLPQPGPGFWCHQVRCPGKGGSYLLGR